MIAPPDDLAVSSPVSLLTLQTLGSLDLYVTLDIPSCNTASSCAVSPFLRVTFVALSEIDVGGSPTVISQVAFRPLKVDAVTVAVPMVTAKILPFWSTLITLSSLDEKVIAEAEPSLIAAVRESLSPEPISSFVLLSLIEDGAFLTMTLQLAGFSL